jgi:hypothetical protein
MLDLTDYIDLWPDELAPISFGSTQKEPFAAWWARVGRRT